MAGDLIVHQFTAVLAGRDAVGWHTTVIDSLLREMGCRTETFAAHVTSNSKLRAVHFREHERYPAPNLILYQMSTGSPVGDYLLTRQEPLVLNYHNITPAEVFEPWEPQIAVELTQARRQLADLVRHSHAAIADSRYNAEELQALGLKDVAVVPILWRQSELERSDQLSKSTMSDVQQSSLSQGSSLSQRSVAAGKTPVGAHRPGDSCGGVSQRSAAAGKTLVALFVGRVAPNKRHEDLIAAFALLRTWRPGARLILIGMPASETYENSLRTYAQRLDLDESVVFAGSVSTDVLNANYSAASVYVSASVHEGFCVPLLEAMSAGLPVVAVAATAVPETVCDAALLVPPRNPLLLALAMDRMHSDTVLRSEAIRRGRERAQAFSESVTKQRMRVELERLLSSV